MIITKEFKTFEEFKNDFIQTGTRSGKSFYQNIMILDNIKKMDVGNTIGISFEDKIVILEVKEIRKLLCK